MSDPKSKKPDASRKCETISVTGPAGGRWRAGRRFGPEPETIDLSTISAEDLAAIEADPELRVARS
jgi:hypothetical protein